MKKIILEKLFSRQKSLLYMMMWDVSERQGYKDFLDYNFKSSLFVYDAKIEKTSVWYDPKEAKEIEELLDNKVKTDRNFVNYATESLDSNWGIIFPYLSRKKTLSSISEFKKYYKSLNNWWAAIITVYILINDPIISPKASKVFLQFREKSERYTGIMDRIMIEFWQRQLDKKYLSHIEFMLMNEAIKASENNITKKEWDQIKKRKTGFFIFKKKVYLKTKFNNLLTKNNLILNEVKKDEVKQFSGKPAFPGIVRGKVQKIMIKNDIKKFKTGSVLVAESTFPEHLCAMKTAIAFVTDEGGITCHAAIVARELKIPCIVGTRVATQILNNGDLVEVDAAQGIIKIIKKAK